jgi:hypothetical protein
MKSSQSQQFYTRHHFENNQQSFPVMCEIFGQMQTKFLSANNHKQAENFLINPADVLINSSYSTILEQVNFQ